MNLFLKDPLSIDAPIQPIPSQHRSGADEARQGGPVPIAWISCVGEKGGAETLMMECLRCLDRSRFKPYVFQLRPGPLQALLENLDVQVRVSETHRMREVHRVAGTIWQLCRWVYENRIQLLHSNGFRAHVYGGLAAVLSGIPEVWTTHTAEQPGISTEVILGIPTAHVLANCPRTAAYFERRSLPTSLIWPGVNTTELERLAHLATREELASKYKLPLDRPWVVAAARLQKFKGQHLFLQALSQLNRDSGAPAYHGIVVGGSLFGQESEYAQELRRQAERDGIAERVTFTGFVSDEDLAGLLAYSQLLVHPALEEDFGLSVAEAQALKTPVLAFASVGPAAIVEHDKTGWLVPVGDVQELARALGEALRAPQRLVEMGVAGSERIQALFSAEQHTKLTEQIYLHALQLQQ